MLKILKLLWRFRKPLLLVAALQFGEFFDEQDRRSRQSPTDIPKKGWRDALKETKTALKDKDLGTTAAGLAYYATLAFFPAVLGLAGLYVIITGPNSLMESIRGLEVVLPAAIYGLLQQSLEPIAQNHQQSTAIVAVVLSVVALLWTTSGGLQNLIKATNKVYEVDETRGLVKLRLTSILLSFVLLIATALIVFLLLLQGDALREWGWPGWMATTFPFARWPILVLLITGILAVIYRYAPNREEPRWQWVSWGAAAAAFLWLIASALFFIYAQNFANFNETYGTFAGVIVLMTWFNVSALIVLIAGQVNKKLETVSSRY